MLPHLALPELGQQHIQSEYTASDAEEETPVRELSTEFSHQQHHRNCANRGPGHR